MFPWNIFKVDPTRGEGQASLTAQGGTPDEEMGFGNLLDVEKPYGYTPSANVDYESEIRAVVEEVMPKLTANQESFSRGRDSNSKNDSLWRDLAIRVTNEDGYTELKNSVINWMVTQMSTKNKASE